MAVRALIVLVALARSAAAQQIAEDQKPPPPPPPPKVEVAVDPAKPPAEPKPAKPSGPPWHFGFAIAGGAEGLAGETFGGVGFAISVERRLVGRLAVAGEVDMLTINAGEGDEAVSGSTLRAMGGLACTAYRYFSSSNDTAASVEVVAMAGGGHEVSEWDRGAVGRDLMFVGVTARGGFGIPRGAVLHGIKRMGMVLGLRFQVAPEVAATTSMRGPAAAGGHDFAFLFHYGLDFGR